MAGHISRSATIVRYQYVIILLSCLPSLNDCASSNLISSSPVPMNVTLNSIVNISCSSPFEDAALTLLVGGVTVVPNTISANGVTIVTTSFNATMNLNGTTMACGASRSGPLGQEFDNSVPALLLIQGQPTSPRDLSMEDINPCSVKCSWSRPHILDGVPLFYVITVTNNSTGVVIISETVTNQNYVFSPMDISATYAFCVSAQNAVGSSDKICSPVTFTGGIFASASNSTRNKNTWTFNYTVENSCANKPLSNASVSICPSTDMISACFMTLVPDEDIQHLENGSLQIPVSAVIPEDVNYNTMLLLNYEGGQQLQSTSSSEISTFDITGLVISATSDNVCLSLEKVSGSTLYAAYIEILNETNDIVEVKVVPQKMNTICLPDLNTGVYMVRYCELNTPPTPATPNVSINNSQILTITPSVSVPTTSFPSENSTSENSTSENSTFCDKERIGFFVAVAIAILLLPGNCICLCYAIVQCCNMHVKKKRTIEEQNLSKGEIPFPPEQKLYRYPVQAVDDGNAGISEM